MKFVEYYHHPTRETRGYITDNCQENDGYSIIIGHIYLHLYHNSDMPNSSSFFGQETDLVDNYDEKVTWSDIKISDVPDESFLNLISAIINSGGEGELALRKKMWDIIFGMKAEGGNWYP